MNMLLTPLPDPQLDVLQGLQAEDILHELAMQLRAGTLIPYLGPGVLPAGDGPPATPEALADYFATRVALPRRARGNAWAAAQHIESNKHRSTLAAIMADAFAKVVASTALHHCLAALAPPMIVDSWYDGAMRAALASRSAASGSWGEVQGTTRAGIGESRWYRFFDAAGAEVSAAEAEGWATVLYKPHGGIVPASACLISDADYVEVLTEIDIQTPIPEVVKQRRTDHNFLFLGCRFHDQLLRSYARQVTKRSAGTHYAVADPDCLTRNERRFLASQTIRLLDLDLDRVTDILSGG